jgi:hypothetical protein
MTTESLEVSRPAEEAPRPVVACAFCRRRLAGEFFFTCLKCEASYCYIHMPRHQPAQCARQVGRRMRAQAALPQRRQDERFPLVLAGSKPSVNSSANV